MRLPSPCPLTGCFWQGGVFLRTGCEGGGLSKAELQVTDGPGGDWEEWMEEGTVGTVSLCTKAKVPFLGPCMTCFPIALPSHCYVT